MRRDRRDRDPLGACGVERAKIGKQMRRGLDKVAGWRKIKLRTRRAALERAGEIECGFVGGGAGRTESKFSLRRIMRRQLPGRFWSGSRRADGLNRRTEHGFD